MSIRRRKNEIFENYKSRRAERNKADKVYSRGRLIWDSRMIENDFNNTWHSMRQQTLDELLDELEAECKSQD